MGRRVLFLNPGKVGGFFSTRIHMGATLMSDLLARAGHEPTVIDYSYLSSVRDRVRAPSIEEAIAKYKPDVVGISVFTYLFDEVQDLLEKVSRLTPAPIMVGGPHVSLFPQDFTSDPRVSYVVRGEAESVIVGLVEEARKQETPVLVESTAPPASGIPRINLDAALGSQYLGEYQIQLSRGCPFNCSFCSIDFIAGRKVRPRELDLCLGDIKETVERFPAIRGIAITDDCPTFNRNRFKEFLRKLAALDLGVALSVDNMRADLLDEEMVSLYIKAGGRNICLGVESANPHVFNLVHKGEKIEEIERAAWLVKRAGLELGLCFVIGLPEDTSERHSSSVAFAKKLRPDYIYWNMCTPWPGTEIHRWFMEHGSLGEVRNFSTLIDLNLNFQSPPATSPEFSSEDRVRAWLMSNLETYNIPLFSVANVRNLPANMVKLARLVARYRLYGSVPVMLWAFFTHKLWYELRKRYARRGRGK